MTDKTPSPLSKKHKSNSGAAAPVMSSDCLHTIFTYLQISEIAMLRLTCQEWNTFIVTGNQIMWKRLFISHYGERVLYLEPVERDAEQHMSLEEKKHIQRRKTKIGRDKTWQLPRVVNYITKEKDLDSISSWYHEYVDVYKRIPYFRGTRDAKMLDVVNQCLKEAQSKFCDPQGSDNDDDESFSWERLDKVDPLPMILWNREQHLEFRVSMLVSFLGALCEDGYIPSRTELVKVGYGETERILVPLSKFSYYVVFNYAQHLYPLKDDDNYKVQGAPDDPFQQKIVKDKYTDYLDAACTSNDATENRVSMCLNTQDVFVPFVFYLDEDVFQAHGELELGERPELGAVLEKLFDRHTNKMEFYEFVCCDSHGTWYQNFHNANFDWYGFFSMVSCYSHREPHLILLRIQQATYRNF